MKLRVLNNVYTSTTQSMDGESKYRIFVCKNELDQKVSIETTDIDLVECEWYDFEGEFRSTKQGQIFRVHYINYDLTSFNAKVNLLKTIKGIGSVKAVDIAYRVKDLQDIADGKITSIESINMKLFNTIREDLISKSCPILKKALSELSGKINISKLKKLSKLIKKDRKTYEEFRMNPYGYLLKGIDLSFNKGDKIATEILGIGRTSPSRMPYYLRNAILNLQEKQGNTYIFKTDLEEFLIKDKMDIKYISDYANETNLFKFMNHNDNEIVQLTEYIEYETNIAKTLNEFNYVLPIKDELIYRYIGEFESQEGKELHETQKEAVVKGVKHNVFILTGGAGTGKTTIVKCIIYCLKKVINEVCLTAPTGKASRRLEESTGEKSTTCHSFFFSQQLLKENQEACLNIKSYSNACMIIDEFSMVDEYVLSSTLDQLDDFVKLIFVGDFGQLESVGCGNVLDDISKSGKFEIVELTKNFRQGESKIIENANKVRNMEMIKMDEQYKGMDFFVKPTENPFNFIKSIWNKNLKDTKDFDSRYNDLQICTYSNASCFNINHTISRMQQNEPILIGGNPLLEYKPKKKDYEETIGGTELEIEEKEERGIENFSVCLFDKVMCKKNLNKKDLKELGLHESLRISNGDFGYISGVKYSNNGQEYIVNTNEELKSLNKRRIKDVEVLIKFSHLDDEIGLKLNKSLYSELFNVAYCVTIHKLQGSEYKKVWVLLTKTYKGSGQTNKLLYTAITRAKENLGLIIPDERTLENVINNSPVPRLTLLKERILGIL